MTEKRRRINAKRRRNIPMIPVCVGCSNYCDYNENPCIYKGVRVLGYVSVGITRYKIC